MCACSVTKWEIMKTTKHFVSKLLIWRQKWVTRARQLARSLSCVARQVENRCVTLNKNEVPRQIDHRILEMSIRRRQSNFSIVFFVAGFEVKYYYRVVSVGQFSFDCRSYCGHSPSMQGVFLSSVIRSVFGVTKQM